MLKARGSKTGPLSDKHQTNQDYGKLISTLNNKQLQIGKFKNKESEEAGKENVCDDGTSEQVSGTGEGKRVDSEEGKKKAQILKEQTQKSQEKKGQVSFGPVSHVGGILKDLTGVDKEKRNELAHNRTSEPKATIPDNWDKIEKKKRKSILVGCSSI